MGKSKGRNSRIEIIKNVSLVALFFTTMLLLYFFWGGPIYSDFKIGSIAGADTIEVPTPQEVTVPGRVIVHLGDGSYSVLDDGEMDSWNLCIDSLRQLSKDRVNAVDEITEEQFNRIMDYRSIFFRFFYSLTYDFFYRIYDVPEIHGFDQIGELSMLAFSSGSPESIFVYSSSKNKYYRIVSAMSHETLSELIEKPDMNNSNYYPIGDLIGTGNKTVIPLSKDSTRSPMVYNQEFLDLDSQEVKEFAQSFFGESLDFVRQIRSSKGSRIYMYGYGDRILTISANGRVGYKNKENLLGGQQSYYEALDTALKFVAAHGGWDAEGGIELKPYVMNVQTVEYNKQKGYRIVFGMRLLNDSIYLEKSHSVMIEVINGQVTQYLRDMINVEEDEYQKQTEGSKKETYSVINMIAQNYPYIADLLTDIGYDFTMLKGEELFDAISNNIIFVKTGYYKPLPEDKNKYVLMPAWVVNADNILIFFDLFDASPLGYTNLSEFSEF